MPDTTDTEARLSLERERVSYLREELMQYQRSLWMIVYNLPGRKVLVRWPMHKDKDMVLSSERGVDGVTIMATLSTDKEGT